jgi:hypothetical protein
MLDAARSEATDSPPAPAREISDASSRLEVEIDLFLDALMQRTIGEEAQRASAQSRSRLRLLRDLREAVAEFAAAAAQAPDQAVAMTEALHLLLSELADANDAEAQSWLVQLAADRGEMMQQIRRRAATVQHEGIFTLTSVFERAVWLIRRLALLDG